MIPLPTEKSGANLLPDPSRCALLVIDAQERLAAAMPENIIPGVLRNMGILIQAASEFGLPVLLSEQYPKGLGPTAEEIRCMLPEELTPRAKLSFSCCREPAFQPDLEAVSDHDLILCGIETHVCVLQTALDLLGQGRRIYIAADACCSRTRLNWQLGLDLMREAGAVIGTTEIIVFGLLRAAGTDSFKRISKLVR
jgi:nicotinamidase-related amidase